MMQKFQNDDAARFWLSVYRESPLKTAEATKEGAKQLITLTSTLQGLYFLAISLSEIKVFLPDARILLFAIPIVPWLVCLGFALSALIPHYRVTSPTPEGIEQAFRKSAQARLQRLRLAQGVLVISMMLLFCDILLYLLWVPVPLKP